MDLMKSIYRMNWVALFLLFALVSCKGNDVPAPEEGNMLIRWDVRSEGMADGRTLINDDAGLQVACTPGSGDEAIGIWSAYRLNEDSVKNVLGVNEDVSLVYSAGTTTGWTYGETPAFWKYKAVYYFNAYFPKEDGLASIVNDSTSLKGTYNTETTQTDLMVSRVKVDTNDASFQGSPVALPMEHALATLKFIFLVEGGNGTNEFELKSFSLDNTLKTKASLNFNTSAISIANWSVETPQASGDGRIHEWSDEDGVPFTQTIGGSPYSQTNAGHLFVIPQTCESAPAFYCTIDMNLPYDVSFENISLGTTQFEPGKNYIYTIKVRENALDLNLSIKDWNELDSSYNIDF